MPLFATPTKDECVQASGCIETAAGAKVTFNVNGAFDIDTMTSSGQLTFTDSTLAGGGLNLSSDLLLEYTVIENNSRAFTFDLSGTAYGAARFTITDNGDTGDVVQIQLLDTSGVPVYDTLALPLSSACAGGVTIGDCAVPSPCQLDVIASCMQTLTRAGKGKSPKTAAQTGACSIVGDSGEVEFRYTIRNTGDTAVPLSSLSVTDSFGPLDLSSYANVSLQPGADVTLTIKRTVTGPFPFVNTVTVSGGNNCSDSDTININQDTAPPESQCDDFVTGGGWIVGTPSGAKGTFGVHGGLKKGAFWGGLNYIDHGNGMHVKSKATTNYEVTGPNCRRISYNVTINGKAGTAVVTVCDNGEPGRNDTFDIVLSDGYHAGGELGGSRPGGGNIQLHDNKCRGGGNGNGGNGGGNGGSGGSGGNNGHNGGNGGGGNSGGGSGGSGGGGQTTNPGTGTPGYWMNHPSAWPMTTITIGGATYTREQAISMLNKISGDVSYTMFRAVVAATLNVAIGNDSSCIAQALADANAWLATNKLGSGVRAKSDAWQGGGEALKNTLDQYNNGQLCAPHRG